MKTVKQRGRKVVNESWPMKTVKQRGKAVERRMAKPEEWPKFV